MTRITITGGSGFVGHMLRQGLCEAGYEIDVFDRWRGPRVERIRHRTAGTLQSFPGRAAAVALRRAQSKTEALLRRVGAIQPATDDILGPRERLVERFRGSDVVIHLAALPHPTVVGMTAADYWRINYEGSINVFEAAREAEVRKFIFASSGQVYDINDPKWIEQFPILETNYLPTVKDGVNVYGFLKGEFERYADAHSAVSNMQTVALRLEFPGVLSRYAWNLYVSCSIENTLSGLRLAIEQDLKTGFEVFNLADAEVRPDIVDIQKFAANDYPQIPNRIVANGCMMGIDKARELLGYNPQTNGTYFSLGVMW